MSGVWGQPNFFTVKAQNTITFNNTVDPVAVFTVTGDVIVKIIAVCTTNLVSAAGAGIQLGTGALTAGIIGNTLATDLDAREIWYDVDPDSEIESFSTCCREYVITDGNDIVLTMDDQVDSGVIVFYCDWTPLSVTGNVVPV